MLHIIPVFRQCNRTDKTMSSPEAVVCLQDVHDGAHWWSKDFVHSEHGGVASGLIVGSDAGVLDAQVLQTHGEMSEHLKGRKCICTVEED